MLDALDRRIVTLLQDGLPICEHPYRDIAAELGTTEADLLARLAGLVESGVLSRFGPMYHAERMGGGLTLCALAAPEARFDEIAVLVNAHPEVAHNYARGHTLNMWFVVATETPQKAQAVIAAIAAETGLTVHDMPKLDEYFIGLRFAA
ncbi:MAG: AsnC family transcriptional regulator [Alphaproteobacteria bacterium]|nr:AsnC family transcriptional regulator [Alphaproteobacteria bacterium]